MNVHTGRCQVRAVVLAFVAALASSVIVPRAGWSHPVTELAVNHFSRLTVTLDGITVRYVVTMSEAATFAELRAAGITNADSPSAAELDVHARRIAPAFAAGLVIHKDVSRIDLRPVSQSLTTSPGERGFNRLRFEFDFEGDADVSAGSVARFRIDDTNHAGQQGWRELVVVPTTGLTVFESSAFGSAETDELKRVPAVATRHPLDERAAEFSVVRGNAPVGARLLQTRDGHTIGRHGFTVPATAQAAAIAVGVVILLVPAYRRWRRRVTVPSMMWRTSAMCAIAGLAAAAMYAAPRQAGPGNRSRASISLIDAATGRPIAGVIKVVASDGRVLPLEGLIPRGQGVENAGRISDWYVLAEERTIQLPQQKLKLEAFAGLKSAQATVDLDLTGRGEATVKVPLRVFADAAAKSWYSANTHLHLRNITQAESDRYLREVPAADDLDALFISYLERPSEDRTYTSNRYAVGDFASAWKTKILLNNGQEHRHNFESYGEGYGHTLLLDINRLVAPVSLGPGITGTGNDGVPLQPGIDEARRQGGTTIWAHNGWGFEDIPNLATGRLDALNIFDGGSHGTYEDSFYHYLNAGLRVPFSTGTDWFIYDLARVYANVRGNLTIRSWLEALKAGRTFITNGPLLELNVGNTEIGGTLALDSAAKVQVRGRATGRQDFGKLQLVRNGRVIEEIASARSGGHFESRLDRALEIGEPCWLALRVASTTQSEYGRELFGHTSPVYITVGGAGVRIQQDVDWLIRDMEQAIETISARGSFAMPSDRERVLGVYREGITALRGR
jgi:hypothetical protein